MIKTAIVVGDDGGGGRPCGNATRSRQNGCDVRSHAGGMSLQARKAFRFLVRLSRQTLKPEARLRAGTPAHFSSGVRSRPLRRDFFCVNAARGGPKKTAAAPLVLKMQCKCNAKK